MTDVILINLLSSKLETLSYYLYSLYINLYSNYYNYICNYYYIDEYIKVSVIIGISNSKNNQLFDK